MFKKYFVLLLAISSIAIGLSAITPQFTSNSRIANASAAVPPQVIDQHYYAFPGGYVALFNPYIGAFDEKCIQLYIPNLKSINGVLLTYSLAGQEIPVANGKVQISGTGNTFYLVNAGFVGDTVFPYVIKDTTGAESTANITFTATNTATILPVADDTSCKIKPATSSSSSISSSSSVVSSTSAAPANKPPVTRAHQYYTYPGVNIWINPYIGVAILS